MDVGPRPRCYIMIRKPHPMIVQRDPFLSSFSQMGVHRPITGEYRANNNVLHGAG